MGNTGGLRLAPMNHVALGWVVGLGNETYGGLRPPTPTGAPPPDPAGGTPPDPLWVLMM